MVKILIDGKEFEGNKVIISGYDTQAFPERDACETTYAYRFEKKEEPKYSFFHCVHSDAIGTCCCKCGADIELNLKTCPSKEKCVYEKRIINIPKEIQFAPITDAETGSDIGLGLIKNNKELFYDEMDGNWNFGSYGVIDEKTIECNLVPCGHNDFKEGEWGVGLLTEEMPNEYDLKEISNYVLWVGKDRVVCIKEEKIADELYTTLIVEEYTTNPLQWFKVIPKSELDRQKSELIKGLQNFPR